MSCGTTAARASPPRMASAVPVAARSMPAPAPAPAPRQQPRVAVAGGGVAGLALAVGLRARGLTDVRVFERDASLESAAARSTGLALWPNGSAALRALAPALHLDKVVRDAGEPLLASAFYAGGCASGAPPPLVQRQDGMEARYGAHAVTLRWRSLTSKLAAALPPETLRFDATLLRYETLPGGGVRAFFVNRAGDITETLDADVLIGADGVRSAVRAQLLGDKDAPPRDAGRVAWRAVVPLTPELEALCQRGTSLMAASPQDGKTMTFMCAQLQRQRSVACTPKWQGIHAFCHTGTLATRNFIGRSEASMQPSHCRRRTRPMRGRSAAAMRLLLLLRRRRLPAGPQHSQLWRRRLQGASCSSGCVTGHRWSQKRWHTPAASRFWATPCMP